MRVSVIVPVYNGIQYILRCIKSILPQLNSDEELIVVDDGSSDGTFDMLADRFRDNDNVILVRKTVNSGAAAARNTGIRLARGEYIAFCDAYDEWESSKLRTQKEYVSDHQNADIVFTGMNTVLDTVSERTEKLAAYAEKDHIHLCTSLIDRRVFDSVGFLDETLRVREDTEWIVRAKTHGISYEYIDKPLYVRHLRQTGLSASADEAGRKQRVINAFIKGIRNNKPEEIKYDVSILIPVFNASKYVVQAVKSCVTRYNAELIIVDDGSSDGSFGVLNNYLSAAGGSPDGGAEMPPMTLIHRKHKGQAFSRNDAFKVCGGRYVLYLDADDYFLPGAVDILMKEAEEDPEAFIVSALCIDFASPDLSAEEASKLKVNPNPYRRMLAGCMLIRRDTFDRVGPYNEKMTTSETAPWVMSIRDAGLKIHEIDTVTLARRYHKDNLGRINREAQMKNYMSMIRNRLKEKENQ